jgi:3-methyladenine DNA glycosylase/8-oxoguanine DNA glycosylase
VKGASTLTGRIAQTFGEPLVAVNGITHIFPAAQVLAGANLTGIGLTTARASTLRSLARAIAEGKISFENVADSTDLLTRLCEIPGIGPWTAQYVALRALGEPDAFPSTDLGLLRALRISNPRELERRAEAWRPWRAYAAVHLWNITRAHRDSERKTSPRG